jgi:hypothetical protein
VRESSGAPSCVGRGSAAKHEVNLSHNWIQVIFNSTIYSKCPTSTMNMEF